MFGWLKKIFSGQWVDDATEVLAASQGYVAPTLDEPEVPAVKSEVVEEAPKPKKPRAKKKKVDVDLEAMSKLEIEMWAREKGLKVDKRKTKATMIKEVLEQL